MTSPQPTGETTPAPTPTQSTTAAPTPSQTTTAAPITFTPEQEAEINRRAAAARKEGERAAEQASKDAATAAEKKRQDDLEVEKGNFKTVREGLESERDGFKNRAEAAEADLKVIWDDRVKRMAEGMKDIPKDARDWDYYPGDEADAKARWTWFEKAHAVASEANAQHANNLRRFPMTPRPNSDGTPSVEDEKRALARTGSYSM